MGLPGSTNLFTEALLLSYHAVPAVPRKWNSGYVQAVIDRSNKRIEVLDDRLAGVTQGRVMPDAEQITIGSGRRFDRLAVLFLDICSFSSRGNWAAEEQKQVMVVMNIFMAEMISIVRDFGGTFEKNTGDGLMAYFGEDGSTAADVVKPAVEAAVVMHYVNDNLISPWLQQRGIDPVCFRVGIDIGPVTIAHVGVPRGNESSIVAVGTPANIACKLMNLIPEGGICIGDEVRQALPTNWDRQCARSEQNSGFVYRVNLEPYAAWKLNHRLVQPL